MQITDKKSNFDKVLELFKSRKSKILLILGIIIVVLTSLSVYASYALQEKVDEYEDYFFEIDKKESTEIKVASTKQNNTSYQEDSKASKIVSCMQSSVTMEELPESVTTIINEINTYYNESKNRFAFKYVDIYTGFSVSYNENQKIFTASTIKAPTDIYIYEQASQGLVDLDEELLYTEKYYNDGAGYIKLGPINKLYTIRELVHNSAYYSDNIAHTMLMDRFKRQNLLEFWQEKGTEAIYTQNTIWGLTNAHDAAIYMNELYDFYENNEEYGTELMNNFIDNGGQFFTAPEGLKSANKSGCAGSTMHDISIVFDENPYILIALSNLGCLNAGDYFDIVSDYGYRLHKAYWEYKVESCMN